MGIILLACSIALQLAAAVLALRLLRDTSWKYAWGTVAAGLLLMAVRRAITLTHLWTGAIPALDLDAELVTLAISLLMLLGVWLLGPHLRSAREATETLRRSEERLTAFLEHLPAAAFIKDPGGRYIHANRVFEALFGLTGKDWRGTTCEDFLPPDFVQECEEQDRLVLEEGRAVLTAHRVATPGGERVLRTQRFPIGGEDGTPALLGGVAWDVTEEERLRERDRRLATAIEHATDLVIMTDAGGTIQYVNPAFEEVTGYAPGEAVGGNPRILRSGAQDDAFYRSLWGTLRAREPWTGRFINRRKDGELYHQETTITPVIDREGELLGYVAIGYDVTHLLGMEERLRHAERMEAIGTLTGGVAHDFNNILSVVLSSADLLLETLPEGSEEGREVLVDLRRTAEVGVAVVRKLLAFSRREPLHLEPSDVGRELEDAAATVRSLLPASIELELSTDPDLPAIHADRGAVHQILLNLAANARDAIEGTGRFGVHARAVELSRADALQLGEVEAGPYVALSVSDDGHGMDEDTVARAFEPFFTTKSRGEGTGLGLATVYSVVKQHGGVVQVYSEVGVGTTVKIFLPVTDEPRGADDAEKPVEGPTISGAGRVVLVAEDDRALRRAAGRMLERMGFEVLLAADGEAAWRVFQDADPPVSLVMSDLVMPKLGGAELLGLIHDRDPDLPLILSSGYSFSESEESMKQVARFVEYLQKPWTVQELATVIGRALG